MRNWMAALLLGALVFPVACFADEHANKLVTKDSTSKELAAEASFDSKKLLGEWIFESSEKDGTKVEAKFFKDYVITVTKDSFTLGGGNKFVMKYQLDAKSKPCKVAFEIAEAPFGVGLKSGGILKVTGDELHLCYSPTPGEAPNTFEAKNGFRMLVLKRKK